MTTRVEHLSDTDASRWDAYVSSRAQAVSELFAWRRVARDAYGIESHFLLAEDGGRAVGALALYEIRHAVFGHYLATALFGTDGGFFAESDTARDALLDAARELTKQRGASYTVVRTRGAALPGLAHDDRFRTAMIDLDGNVDAAMAKLPSKTRNQVRRGQKEGFTVSIGADQVAAFHAVFHEHMRGLGSPAHSLAYYEAIARHLGDAAQFIVVRDGTRLVGGALLCFVNGTAANLHTVALPEFNARCPNYLLYWRMIEEAYARGCRSFDMGRSEVDSSQLAFKENWGPRIVPLQYDYYLPAGGEPPRMDPRNPKYRIAIAAWRMMPLAFTRALGPRLISGIA